MPPTGGVESTFAGAQGGRLTRMPEAARGPLSRVAGGFLLKQRQHAFLTRLGTALCARPRPSEGLTPVLVSLTDPIALRRPTGGRAVVALHVSLAPDPDHAYDLVLHAGQRLRDRRGREQLADGDAQRNRKMAFTSIDAAADAGCDPSSSRRAARSTYVPNARDQRLPRGAGLGEAVIDLFRDLEMPYELIPDLATHSAERGVEFMSTAFSLDDLAAVDPHVRTHKVASFEIERRRRWRRSPVPGSGSAVHAGVPRSRTSRLHSASSAPAAPDPFASSVHVCYPAPPASLNLCVIPELASRSALRSACPTTAPTRSPPLLPRSRSARP